MAYNPDIHHRRTIRLCDYDYGTVGFYFVTICVHERRALFGTITDGIMHLNDAGRMVEEWYYRCAEHFPDIECMELVIMPNHFHCIWHNTGTVGADRCVRPNEHTDRCVRPNETPAGSEPGEHIGSEQGEHIGSEQGEHIGSPLHRVVQWFKTMTTNAYIRGVKQNGWPPFHTRLWQRNYYEHIIRNQRSHDEIAVYILENPLRWANDTLYVP